MPVSTPTALTAVLASLPPAAMALFLLARWGRPMVLLLGLLVSLRGVRGAHRAAMFGQFAQALRRCRNRPPGT
ncbi:hypothetical protein [Actinacidiphila acididurans]|uniref:Uncharacterized protein n=1 Tax=Actinacidiphila acididurans TaxID=2784346 RepID=A0ABS2TWA8_9ACTN|nr:hypothetical protein [Actinacidiphila acididurans]MBM9506786.1 hypothetical protein [Actinacidiphila acididurans]